MDISIGTRKKFEIWMTMYPESKHPLDNERFIDFIKEADRNAELDLIMQMDMYSEVRKYHPMWIEDYLVEFVIEWQAKIMNEVIKCKRRRERERKRLQCKALF